MSDSRLSDEELEEAFDYARGSLRMTAALSELRERRAADLSDAELSAINFARIALSATVRSESLPGYSASVREALAVFSKLLARKP